MILQFATEIKGSRTYFPEKITKSLVENEIYPSDDVFKFICYEYAAYNICAYTNCLPKNFTIRKDTEDLWDESQKIDFFLDKKNIQFLPSVPVVSVQEILMTYLQGRFEISIDDRYIWGWDVLTSIAQNDGFETFTDFALYYKSKMNENGVFSGKIIHWTNLKY